MQSFCSRFLLYPRGFHRPNSRLGLSPGGDSQPGSLLGGLLKVTEHVILRSDATKDLASLVKCQRRVRRSRSFALLRMTV